MNIGKDHIVRSFLNVERKPSEESVRGVRQDEQKATREVMDKNSSETMLW